MLPLVVEAKFNQFLCIQPTCAKLNWTTWIFYEYSTVSSTQYYDMCFSAELYAKSVIRADCSALATVNLKGFVQLNCNSRNEPHFIGLIQLSP